MSSIGTCIDCHNINTIVYKCVTCYRCTCYRCANYYMFEDKWRCNTCKANHHISVEESKELYEKKMDNIFAIHGILK